ncbi:glutaredoxin family protein [Nesterenkonia alkaliphila]|nr:glutaredoxin family protein [Nesterenkonia alkaliphila]GFZ82336.1 hypothetical protein GCM10011359_08830 [Nesterenkonia alkaliphila]
MRPDTDQEDTDMTGQPITVWTKDPCVQCDAVKRKLDKEGVPYQTQNLEAPENAATVEKFRQRGLMHAPVVQTQTETFAGYNPTKLQSAISNYRAQSGPAMTGPDVSGPSVN